MTITGNNTAILNENGYTRVILHHTPIVEFDSDVIRLNTGGYVTATTVKRMNESAESFGLDFAASRSKEEVKVTLYGKTHTFIDSIVLCRETGESLTLESDDLEDLKRYDVFIRDWYTRDESGKLLPIPSEKSYTAHDVTLAHARELCKDYNESHDAGELSRKAEFEEA